ncbi:thioredoxin family protein [Endozoicomonas sp. G2_2]|uniref:TlpA family protein disulfide reductase n=1 Tax=Endozoicomonas sp. G2_2 TaxID=2821092 RepID=UPI001AD9D051|nr:thioredoxin family protein [Endozoicomonas sp. G2_2]
MAQNSASAAAANQAAADAPRYDELPDVLDCKQFDWMKNCSALNRQAKRHPEAPIRAKAPDGTEYTFAPQTPTTVIAHMLDPSIETARAMVLRERRMAERDKNAAQYARQAIKELDGGFGFSEFEGGLESIEGIRDKNAREQVSVLGSTVKKYDIASDKVRVYVFYDSNCGYCRKSLPEWKRLTDAHPDLDMRLLQLNDDTPFLSRVRSVFGLDAATLRGAKRKQIMDRVTMTPTVWIQDEQSNKTTVLRGYQPMRDLEKAIARVSQES